jgi:hypothetical protein
VCTRSGEFALDIPMASTGRDGEPRPPPPPHGTPASSPPPPPPPPTPPPHVRIEQLLDTLNELMRVLVDVIPRPKEAKSKLPYVCPGSYITGTIIHYVKTDAMFDFF